MPLFKLPLSGDVNQVISPFSGWFSGVGNQYGLVNITIGQSSEPKVEADALSDVGSYGKQLGRIGDALIVLLNHLPAEANLTREEEAAIRDLGQMLEGIATTKERHGRHALRPKARAYKHV